MNRVLHRALLTVPHTRPGGHHELVDALSEEAASVPGGQVVSGGVWVDCFSQPPRHSPATPGDHSNPQGSGCVGDDVRHLRLHPDRHRTRCDTNI